MRRIWMAIGLVAVALTTVLAVRAVTMPSRQMQVKPSDGVAVEPDAAAERLAGALRLQTISHQSKTGFRGEPFRALHSYLAETYPDAHRALTRKTIGDYSLLYRWHGADASLKPLVLAAHMDVVPADGAAWTEPPFAGRVTGGYIWGRGALDDKYAVSGLLEAVQQLVSVGFAPERDIYFAFGHDEEIGGRQGAAQLVAHLDTRGVEPFLVLDEGLVVVEDMLPGVDAPVALIGIAEKGYLTLELTARAAGGHSSMPPQRTAVASLARALDALVQAPFEARLTRPARSLFTWTGPEMPFERRLLMANLWLFEPLLLRVLEATPSTNAMIRTTIAPTMLAGGVKENVLPTTASAVVNFRILPGEDRGMVTGRVQEIVEPFGVAVTDFGAMSMDPSPVSPTNSAPFHLLQYTLGEVFPDALVAPSLVVGATDARYYHRISDHVYRFGPLRLRPDDLERIHGVDERIGVQAFAEAVRFYRRLIENVAGQARPNVDQ